MAEVALEVPERVARTVRDTVVLLYTATVEALHLSLSAGEETGDALDEVLEHRHRLVALDRLLDQLGWPGDPPASGVRLTAEREVVRDALHGALIDAGERLAVACAASWREEASAASVREAAAEVIELDRLVREVDATED